MNNDIQYELSAVDEVKQYQAVERQLHYNIDLSG